MSTKHYFLIVSLVFLIAFSIPLGIRLYQAISIESMSIAVKFIFFLSVFLLGSLFSLGIAFITAKTIQASHHSQQSSQALHHERTAEILANVSEKALLTTCEVAKSKYIKHTTNNNITTPQQIPADTQADNIVNIKKWEEA